VESSCEFSIEPLGCMKCKETRVAQQLLASQVVLSSIELVRDS
jgi:hypothetical protein